MSPSYEVNGIVKIDKKEYENNIQLLEKWRNDPEKRNFVQAMIYTSLDLQEPIKKYVDSVNGECETFMDGDFASYQEFVNEWLNPFNELIKQLKPIRIDLKIQEEYGGLSNSRDFTWIKPSNEERNNTKEPSERIIENMNSDIIQSEGKSYLRINEKLLDREKYYLLKGNTCYQNIVGVKQVGPDEVKNLIDCIKKMDGI